MKSLKSNSYIDSFEVVPSSERQSSILPASNANSNFQRVRLPRLHKANRRSKTSNGKPKCNLKEINRHNKYDMFVDQILDLQSCVKKTYGNSINVDSLTRMRKSIESLNRQKSVKNSEHLPKEPEPPSTASSDNETRPIPATKLFYKMTKRVQFKRRLEMAQKCLIIVTFEGVLGDVFKMNL